MKNIFCGLIGSVFLLASTSMETKAQDEAVAKAAIRMATKAYVEAFNRGDAEAVAKLWSPDGTWRNPVTAERLTGRKELKAGFDAFFANHKGASLSLKTQSVTLLTKDVAVEEGTAEVTHSDSPGILTGYTAIHVMKDGNWLLSRVVEIDMPSAAPKDGPMKKIAWLDGVWLDETGGSSVSHENRWIAGGRFMRRTFTIEIDGKIDMKGREIVGWDPVGKSIRSWAFDSTGGFAELRWRQSEKNPKRWTKEAKGTLSSGETVSAIHIMTQVDDDHYTFEAVARENNGELLPNIDEVTVVRASAKP